MADRKKQKNGPMRLDRFLGEMGYGTRSQVKEMVRKGRVQVNGQVAEASDLKVLPEADQVVVDQAVAGYARMEYFMLNKPQGVVSATEDSRYPTVVGLIDGALRRDLFPVGRLDVDTEGLLIITNDGEMAHNLLSPRKHVDKVYMARLSGQLPMDAGQRFWEGIVLEDGTKTLPATLAYPEEMRGTGDEAGNLGGENAGFQDREKAGDRPWGREVLLTIQEGRFHQVKRMFEALGCRVEYLKRISMGPLVLDSGLKPGEYRPLTGEEIRGLKECGKPSKG